MAQAQHRAKAMLDAGRFQEAESLVRGMLQHDRTNPDLLMALGVACRQRGNLEEAASLFRKAVNQRPGFANAHAELGYVLDALDRLEEAAGRWENVLRLRPDDHRAFQNLATVLARQNRLEEALPLYDRAIALKPDEKLPRWQKGLVLLKLGAFESGWPLYADRPPPPVEQSAAPVWRGEPGVAGKVVLLRAEQGMGDLIQFVRYVPLVAALGARVVVEAHAPLMPLLEGAPGLDAVCRYGDPLPSHDWQCFLMNLASVFWRGPDGIPPAPYLTPPPASVAAWRARLGPREWPRIGVVWAGNPGHLDDRNRSIPFPAVLPLLRSEQAEIVVLQKEMREEQRDLLEGMPNVRLVGPELQDFTDTAGAVSACDLVISVDTAVAHLAGALGRPVWVLLPWCPDWRWLLDRADTPWYGTARLFRQKRRGDWGAVVEEVSAALPEFIRVGPVRESLSV